MREYFENGVKVIEYSFEDWEAGTISGDWRPGKTTIEIQGTKERYFSYLPKEEFERIQSKRKEIYNQKAEDHYAGLKNKFERKYNQSENKSRLLDSEISKFEALLFPEKLPIHSNNNIDRPIPDLPYDTIRINSIRSIYKKIIVDGEKEYHFTDSPNCPIKSGAGDSFYTLVEAISKYLDWLKQFNAQKELSKEELFHQILKGIGTIKIIADDSVLLKRIDSVLLDSYLAKYYQVSEMVTTVDTISEAIIQLKSLVLFYKEQGRRPKVTDVSHKDEKGTIHYGWVARDSDIDDWIKSKIILPLEDKISRLEELKSIYVSDNLTLLNSTPEQNLTPVAFDAFLNAKGKKISSYLIKTYKDSKPQIIAYMLFALENLKFLNPGALYNNKLQLHTSLKETFGDIGKRQTLNTNLLKMQSPDSYQKSQIEIHMKEISKAMKDK